MSKHAFQIRYSLAGKSQQTRIGSDADTLSVEQVRDHLQNLHTDANPADITDVEIEHSGRSGAEKPGQKVDP